MKNERAVNMKNNNDAVQDLDLQIALLTQRKNLLKKLISDKEDIDQQLNRLLDHPSETPVKQKEDNKAATPKKHREQVLPRGVLTVAAFTAIHDNKKPLPLRDIVEKVKSSRFLQGNVPDDLEKRVVGILRTSDNFKNVGGNFFDNTHDKLEGRLFERLTTV